MSIRLFGPSLASVSRLVGRPLTAIVAVALIGLSMQARMHAQERPAPPRGAEGARDPREMMKRADTDGDGKVSKAEFMAARTAELEEAFARIDADGDGRIDEAEAGRGRGVDLRDVEDVAELGEVGRDELAARESEELVVLVERAFL